MRLNDRFSAPRARVAAAVAVALALFASATTASAAPGPAAPRSLAGTVTLSGSTTGYVKVVVPRTARLGDPLFEQRKDDVVVEGGKAVAGFALMAEGALQQEHPGLLVGSRFDFLTRQGVPSGEPVLMNLQSAFDGDRFDYVIPKGVYRLYLITDGKPAKVTLRFRGLQGRTSLTPHVRTPLTVQDGAGGLDVKTQAGRTVHTAGADTKITRESLNFSLFSMQHDVHTESLYTYCRHTAKPVGPNPYLPGCPSPDDGQSVIVLQPVSDEYVAPGQVRAFYGGFVGGPGHYGVGGSLVTATPAEDVGYSHFWLGL